MNYLSLTEVCRPSAFPKTASAKREELSMTIRAPAIVSGNERVGARPLNHLQGQILVRFEPTLLGLIARWIPALSRSVR